MSTEKFSELRGLAVEELNRQVDTARKELQEARFKKASHQLEDTAVLGRLKNRIAQIKTVLREKELAASPK